MTQPEHLHDSVSGQHLTFRRTRRQTEGALLEVEVRLDPGGRVPRHAHVRQDERVTVLAGSILIRVGRAERVMRAGDVLDVPRRHVHLVRNAGDEEARFVLEVRPARRMQGAMRAVFIASSLLAPLSRRRRSVRGTN